MRYGSLFTGIGGFDLGFDEAGMSCVWQVEQDKHCLTVLNRHWPDVPKYKDVRNVGTENLESVDLVAGGFPCQDVSIAGNRKGLAGERSGLWFEFLRVITEMQPTWVVIENVPGLLSSNEGRDFAAILRGLEKCGYWWAYRVVDSQFFGVPQRRRRVFIVGCLTKGLPQQVLFEPESSPCDTPPSREAGQGTTKGAQKGVEINGEEIGFALRTNPSHSGDKGDGGVNTNMVVTPYRIHGEHSTAMTGNGAARVADPVQIARSLDSNGGYATNQGGNLISYAATRESDVDTSLSTKNQRNDLESETFIIAATLRGGGNGGVPGSRGEIGQGLVMANVALTLQKESYSPTKTSSGQAVDWCITNPRLGVRRLTPLECERLQGFPDNWTSKQSDSQRYRQLGNAVTVNVARWLGQRIARVNQ